MDLDNMIKTKENNKRRNKREVGSATLQGRVNAVDVDK